jgi:hypothetical protein
MKQSAGTAFRIVLDLNYRCYLLDPPESFIIGSGGRQIARSLFLTQVFRMGVPANMKIEITAGAPAQYAALAGCSPAEFLDRHLSHNICPVRERPITRTRRSPARCRLGWKRGPNDRGGDVLVRGRGPSRSRNRAVLDRGNRDGRRV